MPITKLSVTFCNISLIIIIKTFFNNAEYYRHISVFWYTKLICEKMFIHLTETFKKTKKDLKDIFEGLKSLLLIVILQ